MSQGFDVLRWPCGLVPYTEQPNARSCDSAAQTQQVRVAMFRLGHVSLAGQLPVATFQLPLVQINEVCCGGGGGVGGGRRY